MRYDDLEILNIYLHTFLARIHCESAGTTQAAGSSSPYCALNIPLTPTHQSKPEQTRVFKFEIVGQLLNSGKKCLHKHPK